MKRSEIYREAARHLAGRRCRINCYGACDAIAHTVTGRPENSAIKECAAFAAVFKPSDAVDGGYWGDRWSEDYYDTDELRDCRILALLFMSAIADYEERHGS